MLTTGRAPMNFTLGCSGVSNPRRLLEQAETRAEKFLPVRERAIINAQSIDRAGILFPIVRPASQSLLAVYAQASLRAHCVPPLHCPCVILFFDGGSSRGSSRDDSKISEFHNIVCLIESISINNAYY